MFYFEISLHHSGASVLSDGAIGVFGQGIKLLIFIPFPFLCWCLVFGLSFVVTVSC